MTTDVYDVLRADYGLTEIRKRTNLIKLSQPETNRRQAAMLGFWNAYRDEFRERLFASRRELDTWKLRQLQRLVDWAYTTCPLYQSRFASAGYELGGIRSFRDFESLPILTRDDVISGYPGAIVSAGFDASGCRLVGSSGSSGKQVQLIVEQDRADLDTLLKYRMFEHAGNFRLEADDWLYNVHHAPWWHTSMLGDYRVFSVTQDCDPENLLRHVALLRPKVISCTGSYLSKLAPTSCTLAKHGVALVSTNSESTTSRERMLAEEALGVPVRDEYSSEEIDLIATECSAGRYHVVEDNAYVEILSPETNGTGAVVATDLWNRAMPMIRYDQGDLAAWSSSPVRCACGSGFRQLSAVHGRANDAFRTSTGAVISPASVLHAVEEYFCMGDTGLNEFRVIQKTLCAIEVLFVGGERQQNFGAAIEGFSTHLSDLFGYRIDVKAVPVEALPPAPSYKRKTLFCDLAPGTLLDQGPES